MAIESLNAEQITEYEGQLLGHVPQTGGIGNKSLLNVLGWNDETLYWDIRNRLIDQGFLIQGKGRGGSVRRLATEVPVPAEAFEEQSSVDVAATQTVVLRESDLYSPMAEVIRSRWAKEHRLDALLVEVTAAQGSRQTNGKWTRPDITVASYNTYPYVPGRHFDVITFEIKPHTMLDVTVVYEALGHRRAATRAYALIHIPDDQQEALQALIDDICIEAKRHGVGVVLAGKPDDYDTWDEVVEAVRHEPDPERLNEFLAVQMSQGFREQIIKWFK
jgi:hypothetical protein